MFVYTKAPRKMMFHAFKSAKRAATWIRNNPDRFISSHSAHGRFIVNCYVR